MSRATRLEIAPYEIYSCRVKGKKLLAMALSTGYFFAVGRQLACAETMAALPTGPVGHEMAADHACCHHRHSRPAGHDQDRDGSCCMSESAAPALINAAAVPTRHAESRGVSLSAFGAPIGLAPAPTLSETDSSPPGHDAAPFLLAALSPRAPPLLSVVL